MMNCNTELLYWQENSDWYDFDESTKLCHIYKWVPDRVKNSFRMWAERHNEPYIEV